MSLMACSRGLECMAPKASPVIEGGAARAVGRTDCGRLPTGHERVRRA